MPFELNRLPWVIVLGIACGLVSLYFIRGMSSVEGMYQKMHNPYMKLVVGAIILSVLIFTFPPLYGEGYTSITQLISGHSASLTDGSPFFAFKDNVWVLIAYM